MFSVQKNQENVQYDLGIIVFFLNEGIIVNVEDINCNDHYHSAKLISCGIVLPYTYCTTMLL